MLMNFSDMQSIEGMLLTIIDSLGLDDSPSNLSGMEGQGKSQRSAVKSLVRQAIWDEVHKPYRVWVSHEMVDEAHKEWGQYQGHSFSHRGATPLVKKSK